MAYGQPLEDLQLLGRGRESLYCCGQMFGASNQSKELPLSRGEEGPGLASSLARHHLRQTRRRPTVWGRVAPFRSSLWAMRGVDGF